MVNRRILVCVAFLLVGLVQTPRVSVAQQPSGASLPIASRIATVDGLQLHYLMGAMVRPSSCCTATLRRPACGAP